MGKTYIKEENGKNVLYEENTSPFPFGDKKLGELHENWDGSLETRNAFDENYKLTEERDSLEEVVTCIIPGTIPHDYKVETSEGESGTFKWNSWKEKHEFKKEAADHSSYSSNERISYNRGPPGYGNSKSKDEGGFGVRLFLGAIGIGVGVLIADYTENPNRYNPSYQSPLTQHHSKPRIRKASQEARKKLLENAKDANIVEDFQSFQDSTAEPESRQEIVIPKDEFLDLERLVVRMKRELYAYKKETLEEIESTFVANQISAEEKNWYAKIVESEYNTYLDNFKRKIIGFEMFPKQQQEALLRVIYEDSQNNIDSSKDKQLYILEAKKIK